MRKAAAPGCSALLSRAAHTQAHRVLAMCPDYWVQRENNAGLQTAAVPRAPHASSASVTRVMAPEHGIVGWPRPSEADVRYVSKYMEDKKIQLKNKVQPGICCKQLPICDRMKVGGKTGLCFKC